MAGRNVSNVLWSPFSLRSCGGVKGRMCVFDPGVGWVFVVVLICVGASPLPDANHVIVGVLSNYTTLYASLNH
jgi:hypothetical protein